MGGRLEWSPHRPLPVVARCPSPVARGRPSPVDGGRFWRRRIGGRCMRCVLLAREEKLVSARRRQIDSSALPPSLVGLARVSRIFSPFLILLAQPSQPPPGLLHSCCFCQRPPSARERWPNALPPGRVACSACRHLPSSLVAVSAAHLHPDRPTHAPVPEAICRGNPPAGYIERPSSSARLALRSLPPSLSKPIHPPKTRHPQGQALGSISFVTSWAEAPTTLPFRKTNTHAPTLPPNTRTAR